MSETPEDRDQRDDDEYDDSEDEGPAPTPFDHPLFLPALLFAFMLWFGYDGWLNSEMKPEYIGFNRWGFAALVALTLWFGYKGVQEMREHPGEGKEGESSSARGSDESVGG